MLTLSVVLLTVSHVAADNWAVLVAGSSEYYNYRHQADICHAFQILKKTGFPSERIVVMMYDDIAHNSANPYPGTIINRPDGQNLYPGVNRDYTGSEVTPANFLNVLRGIKTENATKVLETGPDDDIFVYFADHGATGLIAFPEGQLLYGYQLIEALKDMYQRKRYRRLVFYLEACESGSMFDGALPDDWNIYAVTAANPFESSWACYCQSDRSACLGDVFSVNWLENAEPRHINTETLYEQFLIDRIETTTSEVCRYGNLSMGQLFLSEFLSFSNRSAIPVARALGLESRGPRDLMDASTLVLDYWQRRNLTHYRILLDRYREEQEYLRGIAFRESYRRLPLGDPRCHGQTVTDSRCLEEILETMSTEIGPLSEAGLRLIGQYLAPLCQRLPLEGRQASDRLKNRYEKSLLV
jgi:hypothetical protein